MFRLLLFGGAITRCSDSRINFSLRDSCESPATCRFLPPRHLVCRLSSPFGPREREDMNKNELIAKVAKDTRLTRGEAGEAIEATIENIMRALRQGDDVRLIGFGTFTVTRRKAGEARNPQTGKAIRLPASKRAKFKAGKLLKEAVNG